ncbi:hypothetical protein OAD67_02825 [bacterium]|nr:hypothetical protein [bacterium]
MATSGEYRVTTDPSEGPKRFTLQTRITSRGETAVILMGVDSAERVMCHQTIGLELPEGSFVFNVGVSTSGILDQLLGQGALKISRVVDVGGNSAPVCELTPGGTLQPPFEGAGASAAAAAHRAAETAAADASEDAFFNALRAEDARAEQHSGASPMTGGQRNGKPARGGKGAPPGMGGAPPGMTASPAQNAGADILAMLNGSGGGSPFPPPPPPGMLSPLDGSRGVNTPPVVARQMMPRTTRGSTGGGQRVRGAGGASHDDGFFDASAGAGGTPGSVVAVSAGSSRAGPTPGLPGLSPLSNLCGLGGLGGLFSSPAGGAASPFAAQPAKPQRDAGADILDMLGGGRSTPQSGNQSNTPKQGTPSNEDLLVMLAGGGGGSSTKTPPPPGIGTPMSIADLEAEALASATKQQKEEDDKHIGALSAMGALGLGFDDDDFTLPLRVATPTDTSETTINKESNETEKANEATKEKENKKQSVAEKREKKKKEKEAKEEEQKKKAEDAKENEKETEPEPEPKPEEKTSPEKPSVTSYSSDSLLKLRAGCDSVPTEVDLEMFEQADKHNPDNLNAKAKAEKILAKKIAREEVSVSKPIETVPVDTKTPSRSDDRLDEPALGGALGLGFLGISSASLQGMDETETETKSETKVDEKEKKNETPALTSVAELAKALLAELRGLEDRVEVAGDESGPMAMLKLGAALEAIRDEPFKSI